MCSSLQHKAISILCALTMVAMLPTSALGYVQGYVEDDMQREYQEKRTSEARKKVIGLDSDITVSIESDTIDMAPGCTDSITYEIHIDNEGLREKTNIYANLDRDTYLIKASHGAKAGARKIEWTNLYIKKQERTTLMVTVGLRPNFRFDEMRFKVEAEKDEDVYIVNVDTNSFYCSSLIDKEVLLADSRADQMFPTDNTQGNIIASIKADRSETQPGSSIIYSVSIENTSTIALRDVDAYIKFPTDNITITQSDVGSVEEGSIHIHIPTLPGGEVYQTQIIGRTDRRLQNGDRVHAKISLMDAFNKERTARDSYVSIITNLPQTGNFSERILKNNFVTYKQVKTTTDNPPTLWLIVVVLSTMAGIGAYIAKREKQQ